MTAANPAVMARPDWAIHERGKEFCCLLDGRVEPGHDNEGGGKLPDVLMLTRCSLLAK
jgi:hypothetical protein